MIGCESLQAQLILAKAPNKMDAVEFAFPPCADPAFPSWRLGVLKALAAEAGVPLVKATSEKKFEGCLPRKCKTPAIKGTAATDSWISEFGSACRFLGTFLDTELYPSFQKLSFSNDKVSQIDQWIDYCVYNLDNQFGLPLVEQLTKR